MVDFDGFQPLQAGYSIRSVGHTSRLCNDVDSFCIFIFVNVFV